jgi:hypothetical protein
LRPVAISTRPTDKDVAASGGSYTAIVPSHGAALLRISR